MLNHNFLAEIKDLTICIVLNGEKFQSYAMTSTLIGQCPMPKNGPSYFHVLKYVKVSSGLIHYFLSYRVHRHTDTQTPTHTDGHEFSIVAVDKPQL